MIKAPFISRIICGKVGDSQENQVNTKLEELAKEGYVAEDISITSPSSEQLTDICILLKKPI